jgi:GNAT superfamily N-acetyltransferase
VDGAKKKNMSVTIRRAIESDAAAARDIVRRSITQLCIADHHDDEGTLAAWLRNKTVETFTRLNVAESKSCVVAVLNDNVCGFGHISHSGIVGLLYVDPEARFLGASTAMLNWLEEEVSRLGVNTVSLNSSYTARQFYKSRGYIQTGEPVAGFGITFGWPMAKRLSNEHTE